MFSSTHGSRRSNSHTRKTYCVGCGTYIDSVPRELCNTLEATRSATITKRKLDIATRMMLEQVSRLSDGNYDQSAMVQLFLDCVDCETEPSTAFVSFRKQSMHFNGNKTLSVRVVDPRADDGVWAIVDDGCNTCCNGGMWRQMAETKMKILGFHPAWLHRKAIIFNCVGTSTTSA